MAAALAPDMFGAPSPEPEPPVDDVVATSSFNTGLMVLLMILWSSFGHKIASSSKYIGEGSAACAMGLLAGLVVLILQRYLTEEVVHKLLTFNPADFFTYLLPPIIFYAGLSVKKKQFFRNFASISMYGIFGTYICFAVIAFVLYGFSKLPNILNLSDCLALGVIFAATDSVAVLQVLKQERTPLLYSLVFGEGVMNDATAVALLRAVQDLGMDTSLTVGAAFAILFKFLYLFVASLVLGLAFGLGTALLLKSLNSNSTPQEVALIGMLGYLSYLCGEYTGLSGIMCLFCCAVAISHYALNNVSSMSRVTTVSAFQTLSYVSEGAIFIYVGMDTLDPLKWQNTRPLEVVWMFFALLFLLLLGRAVFVFPISWLHNCWAREKLTQKEIVVIWWAGLMRGAIAVALVYYYFDPKGQSDDEHRATLIATTLIVVMFSIMVLGALTKPLLDFMLGPQELGSTQNFQRLPSGRRASGTRAVHNAHRNKYGSLYTVVSIDAHDEVANHLSGAPLHRKFNDSMDSFDVISMASDDTGLLDDAEHGDTEVRRSLLSSARHFSQEELNGQSPKGEQALAEIGLVSMGPSGDSDLHLGGSGRHRSGPWAAKRSLDGHSFVSGDPTGSQGGVRGPDGEHDADQDHPTGARHLPSAPSTSAMTPLEDGHQQLARHPINGLGHSPTDRSDPQGTFFGTPPRPSTPLWSNRRPPQPHTPRASAVNTPGETPPMHSAQSRQQADTPAAISTHTRATPAAFGPSPASAAGPAAVIGTAGLRNVTPHRLARNSSHGNLSVSSAQSGQSGSWFHSPFEAPNVQSAAAAEPESQNLAGDGDADGDNTDPVERLDSVPGGRIQSWWTTFDARYMQPVFTRPSQPLSAQPIVGIEAAEPPPDHQTPPNQD